MFFIGERSGLQAGQFSNWSLLLRSHAIVIAAVVLHCPAEIHKAFPEIDVIWREAYVALKIFIYTFQHLLCLPKHASCPYRMPLWTHIPSEMLAFELNTDNTLEGLPPL